MAKSTTARSKTNTSQNASPGVQADANTPQDTYLGVSWDKLRSAVDAQYHPFLQDEDGVKRIISAAGRPLTVLDNIKRSKTPADDLAALLEDDGFKAAAGSQLGFSADNSTQVSADPADAEDAGSGPDGDDDGGDDAPAMTLDGLAALIGKSKKPAQQPAYAKPVSPAPGMAEFARAVSLDPDAERTSRVSEVTGEQDPNGKMKFTIKFRDGSVGVTSNPAVAAAAQADADAGNAEGGADAQPQAEKPKKTSRFDLPFDEQLEAKREIYAKRNQDPSFLMVPQEYAARQFVGGAKAVGRNLPSILSTGGALTALGLGAYSLGAFGRGEQKKPYDPEEDRRRFEEVYGTGGPPPAAQPQPQPQPNPAGTPAPLNTTLMKRLVQSREYV